MIDTTQFYHLKLPIVETTGPFKDKWFVYGKDVNVAVRASDSHIEEITAQLAAATQLIDKFFFDSELAAHDGARRYYKRHNVDYLHMDEYLALLGNKIYGGDVKSEEMQF